MIINNNLNFYLIILIVLLGFYFLFNSESFENTTTTIPTEILDPVLSPTETDPTPNKNTDNIELRDPTNNVNSLYEIQEIQHRMPITNLLTTNTLPDENASIKNPISSVKDMVCPPNFNKENKKCKSTCGNHADNGLNCILKTLNAPLSRINPTLVINAMVDNDDNNNNTCLPGLFKINNNCYSCPKEYTYDISNNICIKCPNTYDNINNKCEKNITYDFDIINPICPPDFMFDNRTKNCIQYICNEKNYEYNVNLHKCIKCPPKYIYDTTSKMCKNIECPPGTIYENGSCLLYKCPDNFSFDNKEKNCKIIDSTRCNNNSIYDISNNKCVKCNGKIIDNICYNQSCNNDSKLYKIKDKLKCVKCPPKFHYNEVLETCESDEKFCDNNSEKDGDKCISCESGYKYNKRLQKCIKEDCEESNIIENKCYKCDKGLIKKINGVVQCHTCSDDNYNLHADFTCKPKN
jgi:hypothetical protein